ncbi:MAG: hypothetical protein HC881_13340 [Leptolyngbyaceae cyanobacterium SL_7_1]|nr:hypothetical protein [Leptolyngbyaceae cyanobacterium SL_7_1]
MKQLKNQQLRQFGGWISGALSMATVLSGLPAYAQDSSPVLDSSNLGVSFNLTSAPNALPPSDFAYSKSTSKNFLITNLDADADDTVLNDQDDRVVSAISNESLQYPSVQVLPATSEDPVDSAEALTSTEVSQLAPPNSIAQVDTPDPQPPTHSPSRRLSRLLNLLRSQLPTRVGIGSFRWSLISLRPLMWMQM